MTIFYTAAICAAILTGTFAIALAIDKAATCIAKALWAKSVEEHDE